MTIQGLTAEQIDDIAIGLGMQTYRRPRAKNAASFVLRPQKGSDDWRAFGYRGRRKNAVTWEAHRAFMRKVFEINPDAVIASCKATYRGVAHFNATHGATAY